MNSLPMRVHGIQVRISATRPRDDRRPTVREHEVDHRPVHANERAVDRVRPLAVDAAADEQAHRHRHERDRQQACRGHGERLGERERLEHPPFLALQREHRQEATP